VVNAAKDEPAEALKALTKGAGVDCALECSSAPEARSAAVRGARTWGTVCYVGEGGSVTLDVSRDMLRRQVTLMGSWTFSKIGQDACARFIAGHKVPLAMLITHRFTLDEAEQAYQLFDRQTMGKGMILPA
jgi:threonine dehydrogenase-like Zn-dependent dehydrogenase